MGTLKHFQLGLTDHARGTSAARFPAQEGELLTPELVAKARQAVADFDPHLSFSLQHPSGGWVILTGIPAEDRSHSPSGEPPPGAGCAENSRGRRCAKTYPPLAKNARIQGVVRLNVIIGTGGHVQNITVSSGHPLLVPPALEAVKNWVYQTTLLNGKPVEVVTQVEVNFPPEESGVTP